MMKKLFLAAMTAIALAGCGGSTQNNAQNNSTAQNNAETPQQSDYKFLDAKEKAFDGFTLYWLKDNEGDNKFPFDLFGNVPEDVKKDVNMPDGMPSSISAYLIKTNGKTILFDAGLGPSRNGQLLNELSKINVTPEQIDYVYITHFHGDHIGGMLNADGEKVFTNAEVYVSRLEKESDLGKGEQAVKMFEKYGDKIHVFNFGDKLPEDVLAIDAVGHTPGHTAFQKGNLLIIGDLMHALALQLKYPEYCPNFDGDKEKAIASRKRILEYAKTNGLTISGMHLPY
ncbi:MAG: MBL fold metallo-hydrolase [Bacteroidales bacterium]|jgi:glyoxylase-like metal-dependent hydrolase (beta-lactamase superfamily II)|nr:MBL fold metallo-hydrolase [Bacteroidales bacterium]